jgi:sodium/bile acid cotransporter 7
MSETKEPELGQAAPTTKQQSEPKKPEPRGLKKWFFLTIWLIKDQWFLVTLACLIAISARVQVPESQQHIKETVVTYVCVSIIFFITGCTLPTRVLLDNYSRWKIHIYVQVQCFLMTSAMAFAVVSLCATNKNFMDPWLMIGLIFMGCVPTTISSNVVMTRQAHGNTALTVVQSTLGNFLGPFLTPALVSMYTSTGAWYTDVLPAGAGNYGEIYRRVFKQLGLSLFLPMAVGQVVQNVFPKECKTVFGKWKMSKVSSVALLIIIWQTFDQAFGSGAFESVKGSNIIFIVFISIAFFILWQSITLATSIFWLPKADVIACCYCCPAKTPAMGVPLSTVMYVGLSEMSKSKLQIPMVIFQGFQIASGSLLTIVFRRWVRAEEERKAAEAERLAAGTDSTPS